MAIQPQQAREAKEKEQAKQWDSVVRSIEAGIDERIQKYFDGSNEVKYRTDAKNLVYYVTKQLTSKYHGWSVTFDTKSGWISLTPKRETPAKYPWDEEVNPWGKPPYQKFLHPWDSYPNVTWLSPPLYGHSGASW